MSILKEITGEPVERQKILLSKFIRQHLAVFLMIEDAEEIGADAHFADLGTSSADAVGFKMKLEGELQCPLRTTLLFDYPSVDVLTDYLLHEALGIATVAANGTEADAVEFSEDAITAGGSDIAVIAYEAAFPGFETTEAFWNGVVNGRKACKTGGALTFGKLPCEVPLNDSESLELAPDLLRDSSAAERWLYALLGRAVTNFGLDFKSLRSLGVGVYISCSEEKGEASLKDAAFSLPLSNAVSRTLDLRGPSESFNIFCTSSFVAVQHAQRALLNGDCDVAIVAGLNFINSEDFKTSSEKGLYDALLSSRNTTCSFESSADGFYRSEGAGIVILQTVSRAASCHNEIQARIKSVAVSHGGRGYAAEAPAASGIKSVAAKAFREADVDADGIGYIEAHGIGNVISDAIEINALDDIYAAHSLSKDKKWHVGSVKPLIGHSEVASGMASMIKAILSIKNGIIPGISNFSGFNSEIAADIRLSVAAKAIPWRAALQERAAAISSYGIGGLNAHMIVSGCEKNPVEADGAPYTDSLDPVVNSKADSPKALQQETRPILDSLVQEIFGISLSEIDPGRSPVHYGFDSIRIIQLVRRLNGMLNIDLKLGQLLGAGSFKEFFSMVETENAKKNISAGPASGREELQGLPFLELSEVQKGLWYVQESSPESSAFNVPIVFRAKAGLEEDLLEKALRIVLEAHPILRIAVMPQADGGLRHEIRPMALLPPVILQREEASDSGDTTTVLWKLARKPFDLGKELLVRFYKVAVKNSPEVHIAFVVHHIVVDGISGVDFTYAFWKAYTALANGEPVDYKLPEHIFFDFAARERSYLQSAQTVLDREWWLKELEGASSGNLLPYDTLPHAGLQPGAVKSISFECSAQEYESLKDLSSLWNVTLSVLMMSLYNVFLYKLSGREDIVLSSPVEGRPELKDEHAMGCYINLILTRTRISGTTRIHDLAQALKKSMAAALDHSMYPFPQLSAALGITSEERILNPFPASFAYQNIFDGMARPGQWAELIDPIYGIYQETDDHYTLEVYDRRDGMQVNIKYQEVLFEEESVSRHIGFMRQLISEFTSMPDRSVGEIQLLSQNEIASLLQLSAGEAFPLPDTDTCRLIEAQALESPDHIAVMQGREQLTYIQLYQRSLSYAQQLRENGLGSGDIVALRMNRSTDAIAAVLGVLFAGAAYVFIDADYPQERLDFILQDTGARLVITDKDSHSGISSMLPPFVKAIVLEDRHGEIKQGQLAAIASDAAAYVVYTSGSTGQPKGILVSHAGLLNQCLSIIKKYSVMPEDRMLQFASLSFDMSVEELFPYLVSGATVVLRSDADLLPDRFYNTVTTGGVNMLNLPPQFYRVLQELPKQKMDAMMAQIRLVAFGGEALPPAVLDDFRQYPARIFNAYGPSEYTVNTAISELTGSREVNIGRPVLNTLALVLDRDLNLVPNGNIGELYLSGAGLALGYLNLPEADENAFIGCRWTGGKMYGTGDLVYWDRGGNLQYVGRRDSQIKVRGYRIEPGEIEIVLKRLENIKEAVIVAERSDEEVRMTAFYIADVPMDNKLLIGHLLQYLPPYMVPAGFVAISKIPLTPNGKTDIKALQKLTARYPSRSNITKAATATEELLAAIVAGVLQLDGCDVEASFYELGGHSLQAIQIVLRINQATDAGITLGIFFKHRTVRKLALFIDGIASVSFVDSLLDFSSSPDEFII